MRLYALVLHKVNIGLKQNYTCQEYCYGARIIELEYSYNFGKNFNFGHVIL